MTTEITIAYDRRCWARFSVKDATPAEIATFEADDGAAVELAKDLDRAGRLEYLNEDQDDHPDYFYETSDVIEVNESEGSE